jgi:hypothetical protein
MEDTRCRKRSKYNNLEGDVDPRKVGFQLVPFEVLVLVLFPFLGEKEKRYLTSVCRDLRMVSTYKGAWCGTKIFATCLGNILWAASNTVFSPHAVEDLVIRGCRLTHLPTEIGNIPTLHTLR